MRRLNGISDQGIQRLASLLKKGKSYFPYNGPVDYENSPEYIEYKKSPKSQLFDAASKGDLETVQNLLDSGTDPNGSGSQGPLAQAARRGYLEIVEALLTAGANPIEDEWALTWSNAYKHWDISKILEDWIKAHSENNENIPTEDDQTLDLFPETNY